MRGLIGINGSGVKYFPSPGRSISPSYNEAQSLDPNIDQGTAGSHRCSERSCCRACTPMPFRRLHSQQPTPRHRRSGQRRELGCRGGPRQERTPFQRCRQPGCGPYFLVLCRCRVPRREHGEPERPNATYLFGMGKGGIGCVHKLSRVENGQPRTKNQELATPGRRQAARPHQCRCRCGCRLRFLRPTPPRPRVPLHPPQPQHPSTAAASTASAAPPA